MREAVEKIVKRYTGKMNHGDCQQTVWKSICKRCDSDG